MENIKQEVYVSVDVETDGPIPGPHSMLSLGAVAMLPNDDIDQREIGCFSSNLITLPGAQPDPKTQAWWEEQDPRVYALSRDNARDPGIVMPEFAAWLDQLPGLPVCVAFPAGFDFMFVYWYLIKFAKRSPFSFSSLDIKTYAMALRKSEYRKSTKKRWPGRWFPKNMPHTHVALDDAREQGHLFLNMLKENV